MCLRESSTECRGHEDAVRELDHCGERKCTYVSLTQDEILDLHGCKINAKQILSKDDVKSTPNVVKPGFTPFVSNFTALK